MTTTAVTSPLASVNHAMALIGEVPLTDLLPESGANNALAAEIYDRVVDTLLSAWPWRFAVRRIALSALAAAPPAPWKFQYNLPANTLRLLRTDIPAEQYALFSESGSGGVGERRLYSMRPGVTADVVVRPTDELFPAHFVAAVIPQLAAEFAPVITGQIQLAGLYENKARMALATAKATDANEYPGTRIPSASIDPRNAPYGDVGSGNGWFYPWLA